jgi:hypothetical protein
MSKKVKPGVDVRAPNPHKSKRMGRSSGPMVFNEHVGRLVTPKLNTAINNNKLKK